MRKLAVVALLLALLATTGCGPLAAKHQTLTVFAAASLTDTFTELGKEFEAEHDGVTVRFSFGGSSDLVSQVQGGAPADVLASADTTTMAKLGDTAADPQDFASNTLEIAVPPGNPAGIASLTDLARPGVKLVTCAAEVPCGAATQKVATTAHLTLKPVSEEQSVTDVLGKVESGEADAGLVYVTDVKAAGDKVEGVPFPESSSAVNVYPIAALSDSKHRLLATEFVQFVLGGRGRQVLAAAGFAAP
ncbi:MAG TPA: molybdate ABC transporter substrate-binding protein [Marmoricola sp.]|nr:molybdate ABC transporter substrate-binding protein [Marmoricola sp.]